MAAARVAGVARPSRLLAFQRLARPASRLLRRAGVSPGGAVAGSDVGRPGPELRPCAPTGGPLQCASLQVPLDYRHPAAGSSLWRCPRCPRRPRPAQQQGILLVNPGGPGAGGLSSRPTWPTDSRPRSPPITTSSASTPGAWGPRSGDQLRPVVLRRCPAR